ncbi:hypothetical protein ILUMI_26126 [Ignelater luminosus]|uniref:PiggyBac transposable element-derived protein domain-containing protein n=1 Tax=Ignelater luminosus TaxID=2038154 RepID=A0A8K0C949_IGNLU|nr:hypothetical protein ILUMI_26126 [Ignelater luminosus]
MFKDASTGHPMEVYPPCSISSVETPKGNNIEWRDPVGNHEQFVFDPQNTDINPEVAATLVGGTPADFFSLFVGNEILQIMTDQTNLSATQKLMNADDVSENSCLRAWTPTSKEEMKKFLGILGYMVSIVGRIMSRNRFELLLNLWHFSDNQMCPEGDSGYKIKPLINLFQEAYTPMQEFCIDDVPFRGRLIMKQYIPQKTHKYEIKLFKLCSDNKTHLLGILRANRRGNPKEVTTKKLKTEEIAAKENNRGICILKWKRCADAVDQAHT